MNASECEYLCALGQVERKQNKFLWSTRSSECTRKRTSYEPQKLLDQCGSQPQLHISICGDLWKIPMSKKQPHLLYQTLKGSGTQTSVFKTPQAMLSQGWEVLSHARGHSRSSSRFIGCYSPHPSFSHIKYLLVPQTCPAFHLSDFAWHAPVIISNPLPIRSTWNLLQFHEYIIPLRVCAASFVHPHHYGTSCSVLSLVYLHGCLPH